MYALLQMHISKTHDKDAKGSGWKGYQRWKYENESKYAPSGRRDNIDPFLVSKAFDNLQGTGPARHKATECCSMV